MSIIIYPEAGGRNQNRVKAYFTKLLLLFLVFPTVSLETVSLYCLLNFIPHLAVLSIFFLSIYNFTGYNCNCLKGLKYCMSKMTKCHLFDRMQKKQVV